MMYSAIVVLLCLMLKAHANADIDQAEPSLTSILEADMAAREAKQEVRPGALLSHEDVLCQAIMSNSAFEVAAALSADFININANDLIYGMPAIWVAALLKKYNVIETFVLFGADINIPYGRSSLIEWILYNHDAELALRILKNTKGLPAPVDGCMIAAARHMLENPHSSAEVLDFMQEIIKRGYGASFRDPQLSFYLLQSKKLTELFLKFGADPNTPIELEPKNEATPLCVAIEKKNTEVVKALLDAGADSYKTQNLCNHAQPSTPMSLAIQGGLCDIVKLLIEHQSIIRAKTYPY